VALWGLKTGDYGYLDDFYPTRRLKEACKDRGLELRFLFPPDLPAFLEREGPSETRDADRNSRLKACRDADRDSTLFLIRGAVSPQAVRLVEDSGYACVNSATSLELASDKLETARFLSRNGWPCPETAAFPAEGPHAGGPVSPLDFPFVLKPRTGSRGVGVRLVASREELTAALTESLPGDALVAQEYIAPSRGRDLRVFFAGDRILATAERKSADGGLLSNASTGGTLGPHPIAAEALEPWLETTLAIARKAGLWYGTVDYLYLDEGPAGNGPGDGAGGGAVNLTVCEINGSPGFEALERGLGLDIAGALVDGLIESFFPEKLF